MQSRNIFQLIINDHITILILNFTGSYLSTQYIHDRFGLARRDIDSVLPITSNILKYKDVELQLTDVIAQEPRWPTECKVKSKKQ